MTAKTTTERQQALKAKRKAEGLERLEIWTRPEHKQAIKEYAAKLNATTTEAPWPDFAGNAIKVGDTLEHPADKSRFIVQIDTSRDGVSQWRAVYEDGQSLWLGNQIGDKGRAVKV